MNQNVSTDSFIEYCNEVLRLPTDHPSPLRQKVCGKRATLLGDKYKDLQSTVTALANVNDYAKILTRTAAAKISQIESTLNTMYAKETRAGVAPRVTISSTDVAKGSEPNSVSSRKRKYNGGEVFSEYRKSLEYQVPAHKAKKFKAADMFNGSIDILPDVKSHINRIVSFEDFFNAESMETILSQLDIEDVTSSTVANSRIMKWYKQRCSERTGEPTKEDFWFEMLARLMDFARYMDDVAYNKRVDSFKPTEIRTKAIHAMKPMLELVGCEVTPAYMDYMSVAAARYGVWRIVWVLGNLVKISMDDLKLRNQPLSRSETAMYNIIHSMNTIENIEEEVAAEDDDECDEEFVEEL